MGVTHFSAVISTFPVLKKAISDNITLTDQEAVDVGILEVTPSANGKSIIFPRAIEGKILFVANLASATNAQLAKENGKIIFINASFEVCYQRISHDSSRPIAHSKTKEQLLELYNLRLPFYVQNSDIQIDGDNSPEQICQEIKKILPIA